MSESTVITGPEQVHVARMLATIHGMHIELRTSMRLSRGRSAFTIAAEQGWTPSRTHNVKNLRAMVDSIRKVHPTYEPTGTLATTLEGK
jgi:hypothetical protein